MYQSRKTTQSKWVATALLAIALIVGGRAEIVHAQRVDDSGGVPGIVGSVISTDPSIDAAIGAADTSATAVPGADATNPTVSPSSSVITPSSSSGNTSGQTDSNTQKVAQKTVTDPAASKLKDEDSVYNSIMGRIMSLFAWLVGVAALALDWSVYYSIVDMGTYIHGLTAIGTTWRILRDVTNILLIFGFLLIGISLILDQEWYGGWKKLLPRLLIVAVLLNFSLFISEGIIDVSNLFATQFFAQINGGHIPEPVDGKDKILQAITDEGISNKIMSVVGLQTIYGDTQKSSYKLRGDAPWYIGFFGILLFMVVAFVMFSLAFMFIARFVALILLLLLSPVGFMGWAFPEMEYRAGQWRKNFGEQVVTAPMLLLLLYIALALITDANFLPGFGVNSAGNSGAITGFIQNSNLAGFAGYLLSFSVAIGLLFIVIIKGRNMGAFGASAATKWATRLTGAGLVAGGIGWLGRNPAGWAGNRVAKKIRGSALSQGRAGFIGRGIADRFDKVGGASFDVRNTKALNKIQGLAGFDAGQGQKGGYKAESEERKKEIADAKKIRDEKLIIPRLKEAIDAQKSVEAGRILGNMSNTELESGGVFGILSKNPAAAAMLPQGKFDKLMESDNLSQAQKEALRVQRTTGIKNIYTNKSEYKNPEDHEIPAARGRTIQSLRYRGRNVPNGVAASQNMTQGEKAVRSLSNEEVTKLSDEILSQPEVYENLSFKQLVAIQRAGKIHDSAIHTIGGFLGGPGRDGVGGDPVFLAAYNFKTPREKNEINEFWNLQLPTNQQGPQVQPPAGNAQIFVPLQVGAGPRPRP